MITTPVKVTVVPTFLHSLNVIFTGHPELAPLRLTEAGDIISFLRDCVGATSLKLINDRDQVLDTDGITAVDVRWVDRAQVDRAQVVATKPGDLRVWWIPQVPMTTPFHQAVPSVAAGRLLLDALAHYDLFQLKHRIKPDFSNTGGLEVFTEDFDGDGNSEWCEWEDEDGNNAQDADVEIPCDDTRVRDLQQTVDELRAELGRTTSKGTGIEGIDTDDHR